MKLAILAIGTELTVGQILNRNAQVLAERLSLLGFEVNLHLTVPDDRTLIIDALDFIDQHSDVIFITGGLGPTSDDLTRELVSQWVGQSLIFNQPAHDHVAHHIAKKNGTLREAHKHQCYFPEKSEILINLAGTAHGFKVLSKKAKPIFVLPGPPLEIESVWENNLQGQLEKIIPAGEKWIMWIWPTEGAGESEIAHRAEPIFIKYQMTAAYRAHRPRVEVKLHFQEKQLAKAKLLDEELREVLKDFLVHA